MGRSRSPLERSHSYPTDPRLRKKVDDFRIRENDGKESKSSQNDRIPTINKVVKHEPRIGINKEIKREHNDQYKGTALENRVKRELHDDHEQKFQGDPPNSLHPMSMAQVKQELGITRQELLELESTGFWYWRDEDDERPCPVCKVAMTGAEPWYAHLDGRKHRNNMQKYGIYWEPPPKQEEAQVEIELQDLSDSEAPQVEKTTTGFQYRCPICGVPANDLTVYKSHIDGQKHKKRKRELAKTGMGLKEDVCPICRFTLKFPCKDCVNNKRECEVLVGECKHKVHKCCFDLYPLSKGNCLICPNVFKAVMVEFYEELPQDDDIIEIKKEEI